MAGRKTSQPVHFTMEKDGEIIQVTYQVERGMITVSDGRRTSTHRLGSMEPLARAKFIIIMGHQVIE